MPKKRYTAAEITQLSLQIRNETIEVFALTVWSSLHRMRPRRARQLRHRLIRLFLFLSWLRRRGGETHRGSSESPALNALLLRTTFQKIVHSQRIKP